MKYTKSCVRWKWEKAEVEVFNKRNDREQVLRIQYLVPVLTYLFVFCIEISCNMRKRKSDLGTSSKDANRKRRIKVKKTNDASSDINSNTNNNATTDNTTSNNNAIVNQ